MAIVRAAGGSRQEVPAAAGQRAGLVTPPQWRPGPAWCGQGLNPGSAAFSAWYKSETEGNRTNIGEFLCFIRKSAVLPLDIPPVCYTFMPIIFVSGRSGADTVGYNSAFNYWKPLVPTVHLPYTNTFYILLLKNASQFVRSSLIQGYAICDRKLGKW